VLLVLPGNKYADLLDYGTLGDWLGYAMVVATLVYYRRSGESTSFRVPGYPWLPALFIVAVLGVLVGHTLSAPRNAAISLGLILAGLPVYWLKRRFNARAAALGP
jgi:APA family basic amino acid/polyamine antiporter